MNRNQRKRWGEAIKYLVWTSLITVAVLVFVSLLINNLSSEQADQEEHLPRLSESLWEHRPLVEKYAEQEGVEEHVDTILAMMMQESGGRGTDPMQSSESFCGERGCIEDVEESIEKGVAYFSSALEKADGDVKLAVQSYNFGHGFINYVQEDQEGAYSEEAAIAFSQHMYEESGKDESIYTCLRAEAEELEACYGDIHYVTSVMGYKEAVDEEMAEQANQ
ncbi:MULTISPECIES: lysozyme family protein [Gracilibacillus]|uniref:lysozyme family protein n=1 Tax=Gracilibacillus TaxID=74385 RepID=UPI0008261C3F|nr:MULTISPECIES: lysozyme family protein [Gracilibacillus]